MSYLLQNRRRFYETILPRIPDQKVRKALEEINQLSGIEMGIEHFEDNQHKSLLSIELDDAFKKPAMGERLGRTVISVEELIEHALRFEQLCHTEYSQDDFTIGRQIYVSSGLKIEKLRKLRDSLQYHRFRLID
ncbi:MAG: hypothetical protein IPP40_01050 [bacterium]|nr:hypothetical protein [bacterium]